MVSALEQLSSLSVWLLVLPAAGALACGLLGSRMSRSTVACIATFAMAADFVLAVRVLRTLLAHPEAATLTTASWTWFAAGPLQATVALRLDALAAIMACVITGVGTLVHVFSWGYQKDEPGLARYYAELNFFCAAMLLLVLSDSLLGTFVGWEGVGLASYLLIGFDFAHKEKASAGKKAFVVNRIGDVGFLLGSFVLWNAGHSFVYGEIAANHAALSPATCCAAGLLFALAAAGKSAQLPLFVWLPDAMAGPTPVSALIHAATMVTAGIYLTCRLSFLYAAQPLAGMVVACIGAATALFAAGAALAQRDIKKVLAYSTVSQLGYMFLAVGLGAAPAAMFHVLTHASFKACLFLAAGAVIHGLGGLQDLRQMGALWARMPQVAICFGVSALALAGVPPLSGFVSKDAILAHAFALGRAHDPAWGALPYYLYAVGLLTAVLTAFYMGRVFLLAFFSGPSRTPEHALAHAHEAPLSMAGPLWILAGAAVVLGATNWPHVLGGATAFDGFVAGALGGRVTMPGAELSTSSEILLLLASVGAAGLGLGASWWRYGRAYTPERADAPHAALSRASRAAFGVDAAYDAIVVRPYGAVAHEVLRGLEQRVFEGGLRAIGSGLSSLSFALGLFHSGNVQRYLAIFALALAAMLGGWLWPRHATAAPRPVAAQAAYVAAPFADVPAHAPADCTLPPGAA